MRASWILVVVGVVACAEVRVEPSADDGADGSGGDVPTGATGGAGGGGAADAPSSSTVGASASTGGAGSAGGEPAGPVPGCEQLVWFGEPLLLRHQSPPHPQMVTLDGGDVGLVHSGLGTLEAGRRLTTRLVRAPFETWPPAVEAAVETPWQGDWGSADAWFSARPDGTFAVAVGLDGVAARFGQADVLRTYRGFMELDPRPDAGGYLLDSVDEGGVLSFLATVDPAAVAAPIATVERAERGLEGVVLPDGSLLFAQAGAPANDGDGTVPLELFRATPTSVEALGAVDGTSSFTLMPRPGGAWLASLDAVGLVLHILPLDARGAVAGAVWSGPTEMGIVEVVPWRDGFAIADVSPMGGVSLRVSDGVHVASVARWDDDGPLQRTMSVTSSSDGRSVLVASEVLGGIALQRADCLLPVR